MRASLITCVLVFVVALVATERVLAQPYEPTFLLDVQGEPGQSLGLGVLVSIGDQDGDGFDDILLNVQESDNPWYGHLRIVFGGPAAPYRTLDFGHVGADTCYRCRWQQLYRSTCGDYNGDGETDIMIGMASSWGVAERMYLYLGGPGVFDTVWDWRSDGFGLVSHGTVGDYDADGHADYIRSDPNSTNTHFSYYSGTWPNLSSLPTWIYGRAGGTGNYGMESGYGDATGDGWPDFVYECWGCESGDSDYVDFWYGGPGADSIPDFTLVYWRSMYHPADWRIIGDVNGDGVDDLMANTYENPELPVGKVFLGGLPLDCVHPDGQFTPPSWEFIPDHFAVLGDVNDDGCEDMGFYSAGHDLPMGGGYVLVYLGHDPPDSLWDLAVWRFFDGFVPGWKLSAAGDFNGDGIDDWMFASCDSPGVGGQGIGRVIVVEGDRRFGAAAEDRPPAIASAFTLGSPYPNPFNSTVTIPLTVSGAQPKLVEVTIHNVLGQEIRTFGKMLCMPGTNALIWDGRTVTGVEAASGTYLVRAMAGNQFSTVTVKLIR